MTQAKWPPAKPERFIISVSNFQSGIDKVQLTGTARTDADKNGDAALASATNGVSMTNELVSLSPPVTSIMTCLFIEPSAR